MNTIVDICVSHSQGAKSGELAYCFLSDGEEEEDSITFAQLDRRARVLASRLTERRMRGERVLLLFAAGIDYICAFMGCLYAGAIAVPAFPPSGKRVLPRLRAIARDCGPAMALADRATIDRTGRFLANDEALSSLEIVATDEWADFASGGSFSWTSRPDEKDVAFLQYTSGSTSDPKGVIITQGNLLANEAMISRAFGHGEETRVVGWLPPYHDMGLIGNILQPLYLGCPYYFMSPSKAIRDPYKWLSAISRYKGTTSGAPNFAYDLCVRRIDEDRKASLDLSSWTVAFNGSEPIRSSTLDRFSEAFKRCGFSEKAWLPCYGLAEATLLVSGGSGSEGAVQRRVCDARALENNRISDVLDGSRKTVLVSSGEVSPFQDVQIIDTHSGLPAVDGCIGEIWLKGPNISAGYWGLESLTAEVFQNDYGKGSGYLRTGDLGYLDGRQLYVTGRLKDLLIARGRNIYPQDVERLAQDSHEKASLGAGAAFSYANDRDETKLVLVQEVSFPFKRVDYDEMFAAMRKAVREGLEVHLDEIVLVKPGNAPKTTSGKIQRAKCRELYLAGALEALSVESLSASDESPGEETADLDGLEKWVIDILSSLGDQWDAEADLARPLAGLGLDSIQVMEFSHKVEEAFGVRIASERLFELESVQQLVACLREEGCELKRHPEESPSSSSKNGKISLDDLSEEDVDSLDEAKIDELLKTLAP